MKGRSWISYVFIAVVLIGIFFFAYYKPKHATLKGLKNDRVTVETEVQKLRVKKRQMDQIEKDLLLMGKTLKNLEAIIPQKKETSDILSQFQQLAYDSRLNITKFTPKGEVNREFYLEWPIPIEITGSYHNLGMFFDRLSRFSRLFTIEKFLIKALARQSDAATISASFTSKTYIFLDESQIKPPEEKPKTAAKKQPAPKTDTKSELKGI